MTEPSQLVMVVSMIGSLWLIEVPQSLVTTGMLLVGSIASARQLMVSRPFSAIISKSSGTR